MNGQFIINIAEALMQNLNENDNIIIEKRISNTTLENVVKELLPALSNIKIEMESSSPIEQRIQKATGAIGMIINSLSTSLRAAQDDLIRLEATQDGMKRALTTVKKVGQNVIEDNKKEEESKINDN
jgi:hypothetical protein